MLTHFSRVRLFAMLWTVACQIPLSMGLSRQEYWSGLPCPPPGDLPHPEIKLISLYIFCMGWQVLYQLSQAPPGKLINSMDVPQDMNSRTTKWSSNFTLEYISKGNEIITSKRYLYCQVYCTINHNSQGMEKS